MSPTLDKICPGTPSHIGFAVADIPKAVDWWRSAYGAGPFLLLEDISFDFIEAPDGEESLTWEHSTAFGQWGEIGVELQQYHSVSPPPLAEKLRAENNGFNHVSYIVEDFDGVSERLDAAGMPCFVHAKSGGIEIRIHDVPEFGHGIELHRTGEVSGFFAALRKLAEDWDGSDPLRPAGG
jgi:catechol 2,3-dioxygenase-like lactoylglutathione lyase family enzyme